MGLTSATAFRVSAFRSSFVTPAEEAFAKMHRNLRMDRPDLAGLPREATIPAGFRFVPYEETLLPRWLHLLEHAFPELDYFTPANWREHILDQPQFRPEWVALVERTTDRMLCASAFAWVDRADERVVGRVHWVATHRSVRGLGLGRAVTVAVLRILAQAGFERVMLETQAFRIPAIRLYLSLSFVPTIRSEEDGIAWAGALERIEG
jgi:ribosomal protein S18 acetylase RimI-like enzyme